MFSRSSKLAAIGVFFATISLSQSSRTSLRGEEPSIEAQMEADIKEEAGEIEYITMEDIDAMMELEHFEEEVMGGGLRKLQIPECAHGGQSNQYLTWLGKNWGNCQNLDPCVCGMHPRRLAYWCPQKCLPACGGQCAYTSGVSSCSGNSCRSCPSGFNLENGSLVSYSPGSIDVNSYPNFWPYNWGYDCSKVDSTGAYPPRNVGAPGYNTRGISGSPPTPAPVSQGSSCQSFSRGLNQVCTSTACCQSGYRCSTMTFSDGNRYCMM